jgi:hypothetical protein
VNAEAGEIGTMSKKKTFFGLAYSAENGFEKREGLLFAVRAHEINSRVGKSI